MRREIRFPDSEWFRSKISRRVLPKQEEQTNQKKYGMRYQVYRRMQRAHDDVERQPNDEQPTRPILAVQHKDAGDNLGAAGKMDHPMFLELVCQLSAVHVHDGPQACHQRNRAEDYEQPTDDGDREWALFHDRRLL